MAVVIEIAGISCSGKSTAMQYFKEKACCNNTIEAEAYLGGYYKSIANGLLLKDTIVKRPIFKVIVVAIEHLKNIFNYRQFYFVCLLRIIRNEGKVKALRSFFFKIGKYYIFKKANVVQIIMDEGPVQMLFALFVNRNAMDDKQAYEVKTLVKCMPMADKVIFGPSSPEELFVSRMMKRGHHRVTGSRHRVTESREIISDLNKVTLCESEMRKRALLFIDKSVQLQKIIFQEVKNRTKVSCLSDVSEWNKVVDDICV
jgi:hypothetical protein